MSAEADLRAALAAALARVDPERLIADGLRIDEAALWLDGPWGTRRVGLDGIRRIRLLAVGKAAAGMARAVERRLGARLADGLAVTKDGHALPLDRVVCLEAAHPIPDARGVAAAARLAAFAQSCDAATLVLVLVSGGGSALVPTAA